MGKKISSRRSSCTTTRRMELGCAIILSPPFRGGDILHTDGNKNPYVLQINGVRVARGQSRILRDGNEIAFGSPMPQENPVEDYRYIYRHLAPLELTGIHAHYDMAHELGRGTFATVMKAMSRESGEWFAVKIIHGNKVRPTPTTTTAAAAAAGNGNDGSSSSHSNNNHKHQLQAFGREISILETLDHPNICRLRETFVPDEKDHDFCELSHTRPKEKSDV